MKHGDRNIVYLAPMRGSFRASFALGDKAVNSALDSGLPARVVKLIKEAKRYAEGTAVRVVVKSSADVEVVLNLAEIKLESCPSPRGAAPRATVVALVGRFSLSSG